MATFTIRNLNFVYPSQGKKALEDINLEIGYGEFVAICGKSGCGKSTLLRNLKTTLTPHGVRSGEILFYGRKLESVEPREQASRIGFVLQNPDNQIVTDKVWHELAFGLESLGMPKEEIRIRVSEMASFFGIGAWFMKDVSELSGGQKQILNLAAVMAMQPDILILDEPTSQLDPIAAGEFLENVRKINREIGTTVIISEHRLEDVLPMADRVVVMDSGKIIACDTPANTGALLSQMQHDMFLAMPSPLQAYSILYRQNIGRHLGCPITVRDGRHWLTELLAGRELKKTIIEEASAKDYSGEKAVIEAKDVWFRYKKDGDDIVKDLSLKIYESEVFCIVGGNGTGKTTSLKLLAGLKKPYRGKISLFGKKIEKYKNEELFNGLIGMLPQDPQSLFVENTVRLDLLEMLEGSKDAEGKALSIEEKEQRVSDVAEVVEITELLESHPYDLSGGEQQRAALAKILLLNPRILFLDEPTKGLDSHFKEKLARVLEKLTNEGRSIVIVSHDVEFCGKYGDRCAMFFDGNIVTTDTPRKFFSGNSFYTTSANRMSRHIFQNAISATDVAELCIENLGDGSSGSSGDSEGDASGSSDETDGIGGSVDSGGADSMEGVLDSSEVLVAGGVCEAKLSNASVSNSRELTVSASGFRVIVSTFMIVFAIGTVFAGMIFLEDRKYYFISLLIVIYSIIPFYLNFERRKPQAREIVLIAVLGAIGVAGRAAFFMLPQFKPVAAIVIISGLCLGAQRGFLIGSMTAFVSNFLFGQGPWTPWQMIAFGIVGFLAGAIASKGFFIDEISHSLRHKKILVLVGAILTFFVYGGLVDLWTIFGMTAEPTIASAISVYALAVPFNAVHAAATAIFLFILARPMIQKLGRIKLKYGL